MAKGSNENEKMVITEEKILANIDKVRKMINPNSKKQIVQLEEDSYFLDLIASIKSYLEEYPKEDVFPKDVYKAAYDLVDYATTQFEENTKKIEELIRKRENNIALSTDLKEALAAVEEKAPNWKKKVQDLTGKVPEEVVDTLGVMGRAKSKTTQSYADSQNIVQTKIDNLESNLYIEVDMERIEDKSKALSYIGIEIADSLKEIKNVEEDIIEEVQVIEEQQESVDVDNNQLSDNIQTIETDEETEDFDQAQYIEETTVEVKPSLWERIKNMKLFKGIRYLMRIKVCLELPESTQQALPEAKEDKK